MASGPGPLVGFAPPGVPYWAGARPGSARRSMHKGRLEAFSDGVLAIVITIMVLELHVPHGTDFGALRAMTPKLLAYALSFTFVAIYWNNHHHMMHAAQRVSGSVLWANMHLLFWLSLTPWVTAWMGEHPFTPWPVAAYGGVLVMAALAYYVLAQRLLATHGRESAFARALGRDFKGLVSLVIYVAAEAVAFVEPRVSCALFVAVAILWLVPDRRFERAVSARGHE
jgi:uncharacterized membrane protein